MDSYSPSSYEATAGFSSRKKLVLSGAAILAVGAIAVGAWFLVPRGPSGRQQDMAALLEEARTRGESCPSDRPGCSEVRVSDVAVRAQSPEACRLLDGDAYRDCVWKVAGAMNDPSACSAIEEEGERARCQTAVALQVAFSTGNIGGCADIPGTEDRMACEQAFLPSDCSQDLENPNACADEKSVQDAMARNDGKACDAIRNHQVRNGCYQSIANQDPDADGLMTKDEFVYDTSPTIPDTDGDGFKDGDEVKAGYDPNGPGKL